MKIYKYGDNVDTDVIIPARYLNAPDEKSLASHCMEDIDADFATTVEPGDIVVGGSNFGCGSSREHAPLAIKACGVKCVIAKSFAAFSTATPSTSASPSWSALRRWTVSLPVTASPWTLPRVSLRMRPPGRLSRLLRSPSLSTASLSTVACSTL